jgi:hypothetical protein
MAPNNSLEATGDVAGFAFDGVGLGGGKSKST